MNNFDDYWKMRDDVFNKSFGKVSKEVAKAYQHVNQSITKELVQLYEKITADGEYLLSDLYRYDKYYILLNDINAELTKLGNKEISLLNDEMIKFYTINSQLIVDKLGYKTENIFENSFNNNAEEVVRRVWCPDGKIFSDRIWLHKSALEERLKNGLVEILLGKGTPQQLADNIAKSMNVGYNVSKRLVNTELSYIQNKAAYDRYADAGIQYYEFIAILDDKTCADDDSMNHKVFPMSEAQVGVNFPPTHPNCRCGILPVLNINQIRSNPNV